MTGVIAKCNSCMHVLKDELCDDPCKFQSTIQGKYTSISNENYGMVPSYKNFVKEIFYWDVVS